MALFRRDAPPPAEPRKGPSAEDLRIAACALLLEVAYADDDFVANERRHLREVVRRHFRLGAEDADELIAAAEDERRSSVDLWAFTALVREHYSVGQKMVLAEAMWGLVLADGRMEQGEDYVMRKISGLLGLRAGYLSEARRRHLTRGERGAGGKADQGAGSGPGDDARPAPQSEGRQGRGAAAGPRRASRPASSDG